MHRCPRRYFSCESVLAPIPLMTARSKQINVTIQGPIVADKSSMLTTVRLRSCHLVMHWAEIIIGGEVSHKGSGSDLLPPPHDGVFSTFANAAPPGVGLLARPVLASEYMPDAGGAVGHPEAALDQFGHPQQCPEFGGKAVLTWPFQKHPLQPSELPIGQLWCGTGMGLGLEGLLAAALAGPGPLADGSGGHAKFTGYFNL